VKLSLNIFLFAIYLSLFSCSDERIEGKPIASDADSITSQHTDYDLTVGKDTLNPIILADFNNDKKNDTIYIVHPEVNESKMECEDSICLTYIFFKNNQFPTFAHEQALGGVLANAGDLDDDGMCELYFVPDWFTSNWTGLNIYSLKQNKWILLGQGSIRREVPEMENELYTPYEKRIIKHKGYFEILENVMDEDGSEKLVPKKFYLNK